MYTCCMFEETKRLMRRVEELEGSVWKLQHPPLLEIGDMVEYMVPSGSRGLIRPKCRKGEVIQVEFIEDKTRYGLNGVDFYWLYHVFHKGIIDKIELHHLFRKGMDWEFLDKPGKKKK